MSRQNKKDNVSALYKLLKENRDAKHIIVCLDNCSSQNKNWGLFTFLVYVINSSEIAAQEITLCYFQPGHTFMSADSFYHQVENSLRKNKKKLMIILILSKLLLQQILEMLKFFRCFLRISLIGPT